MFRSLVLKGFENIQSGRLKLVEGDTWTVYGNPKSTLVGEIHIHHPSVFGDILFGGGVGAAEAFMRGDWSSPDLTALIQVMARNMRVVSGLEKGLATAIQPLRRGIHFLRRNTRKGSRKNIAAHYDLSNEFFALMLDQRMMYSCAFFPPGEQDLGRASTLKLDRICRKLDLQPNDHLVEIGTGWGGFAIYAAKHFGCKVTTTTISRQQYEYAQQAIREAGLEDKINLLFSDYRDLTGKYDKLVSIEMIEAVGHQFLPAYFETCSKLLKPEGRMVLQVITIPDDRYEAALKEVDFIKRYIFPGSFIPSIAAMLKASSQRTNLRLTHLEDQTDHYAITLAKWRDNFLAKLDQLPAELDTPEFIRKWRYYLAYCEGGFRERVIGSAQLIFSKPLDPNPTPLITFEKGQ